MLRIMQGPLSSTSGSAARGLLGMLPIEVEIDKRKLYFLRRLINIGTSVVGRRVLFNGFVPDIQELTFWKNKDSWIICWNLFQQFFFRKKIKWKKIVSRHIYGRHNCVWQEKIEKINNYISIIISDCSVAHIKSAGNAFLIQLYTQMFVISAEKGLLTPSTTRCYIVQLHMMRGKICGIGEWYIQ